MCLTKPSTLLYSVVIDCSSLCVCSVFVHRHVMNELLETERAYVEELMCVLQVSESVIFTSRNYFILLCGRTFS